MRAIRLSWLLVLFALLSAADFGLTYFLIQNSGGTVYESNPIAGWWLTRYGWAGLAGFKLGQVVLVASLGLVIARWKPKAGRWLLTAGCAVVAGVVIYSVSLAHGFGAEPGEPSPIDLARMNGVGHELTHSIERGNDYRDLLIELAARLADDGVTLEEGVNQLASTPRARSEDWLTTLRTTYHGLSDRECLATNLVTHSLMNCGGSSQAAGRLHARLNEEFRDLFGRDLPRLPIRVGPLDIPEVAD